jgi:hypothetical protein
MSMLRLDSSRYWKLEARHSGQKRRKCVHDDQESDTERESNELTNLLSLDYMLVITIGRIRYMLGVVARCW